MAQSLAAVYLHIVFSTKNRTRFFQDATLRDEVHRYLGGICKNMDAPPFAVGGVEDHVHILCRLSRSVSVADFVRDLKRESSKWLKTKSRDLGNFHWQDGYGVFSVSPSHLEAVRTYVANQERRHKSESFQDEFRRLLTKYRVEFDERYVWD